MNKYLATLLIGLFMVPSAAFAQVSTQEVQYNALVQQLIELLLSRVEELQAQLVALQSSQDEIKKDTKRVAERSDREEEREEEREKSRERDDGEAVGGSGTEDEDVEVDVHAVTVSGGVLSVYVSVTSNESDITINEDFSFELSPHSSDVTTKLNCSGGCRNRSTIEEGDRANIYFNVDISELEPGNYTFKMGGFNYESSWEGAEDGFVKVEGSKTFTVE